MSQTYQWSARLTGVLLSAVVVAQNVRSDVNIVIRGTVIEPACSVTGLDGDTRTEVDFGSVPLNAVGTAKAQQPLRMRVTCNSAVPSGKSLKIYVNPVSDRTMSYNGRTVLGTSMIGLGIELMDEFSTAVTPETWVAISGVDTGATAPAGEVTLLATLVTADTGTLVADSFTSSASVVMAYQ
ncbi:type 1 fimbrial protein [Salmonella enterica]|nr:type 1 fimbrial protein [Salmonella enterica]EHO4426057.1 type 1 fimbrial protein [Salmonella enterica]